MGAALGRAEIVEGRGAIAAGEMVATTLDRRTHLDLGGAREALGDVGESREPCIQPLVEGVALGGCRELVLGVLAADARQLDLGARSRHGTWGSTRNQCFERAHRFVAPARRHLQLADPLACLVEIVGAGGAASERTQNLGVGEDAHPRIEARARVEGAGETKLLGDARFLAHEARERHLDHVQIATAHRQTVRRHHHALADDARECVEEVVRRDRHGHWSRGLGQIGEVG